MSSAHEQWRDVPGYEGLYRVSDQGRVYSLRAGRVLRPQRVGSGYHALYLCRGGRREHPYVHRLVASAFLGNPENKTDINHKDGNKTNNALYNLEWSSRGENNLHSRRVLKHWTGPPKKRVVCTETGKVYDCALSAARDIGVSRSGVNLVCLGYNKTIKNLHFKYFEEEQNYGN